MYHCQYIGMYRCFGEEEKEGEVEGTMKEQD